MIAGTDLIPYLCSHQFFLQKQLCLYNIHVLIMGSQ